MSNGEFTVENGLHYQKQDLDRWKSIMKPDVYAKLEAYCELENMKPLKNWYDVFRGQDLYMYVADHLMR